MLVLKCNSDFVEVFYAREPCAVIVSVRNTKMYQGKLALSLRRQEDNPLPLHILHYRYKIGHPHIVF